MLPIRSSSTISPVINMFPVHSSPFELPFKHWIDNTSNDDDDLDVVEYEEFVLPDEFERSMGISLVFVKVSKIGIFF